MPFVYLNKISGFDMVMVSHGDNDHAGGLGAIVRGFYVKRILSSETKLKDVQSIERCVAGQSWHWDGVNFSVLYPANETLGLGNDSSCVLVISNQYQRVILPGDIEKFAENVLLRGDVNQLKGSVLIAPHHGSKTSSTPAFLDAVRPHYVIYSTGYLNRYHLPHPAIVDRYQQANVIALNTVDTGTITFRIADQAGLQSPLLYRHEHRHYWQNVLND
jgi:competence protein ComEC